MNENLLKFLAAYDYMRKCQKAYCATRNQNALRNAVIAADECDKLRIALTGEKHQVACHFTQDKQPK